MAKQQRIEGPYRPAVGVEGETLRRPLAPVFTARQPETSGGLSDIVMPPGDFVPNQDGPQILIAEDFVGAELAFLDGEVETIERPAEDPEPEPSGPEPYWRDMSAAPKDRPIFLTDDIETTDGALSFWRTTRVRNREKSTWDPCSFWARLSDRRSVPFDPIGWRESGMFKTVGGS